MVELEVGGFCDDGKVTGIKLAGVRIIYLHKLAHPITWVDHLIAMTTSKCYITILTFVDLLVDIIRQLTDINDEDRRIGEKLQNDSYRRFAFRQVKDFK